MIDRKLLYTSDDDFSLYIEKDNNKFIISLFDNQSKLEYSLADYIGDTYIINKYNQDKFEKYFITASKNNKLIKHNMISYIRGSSTSNILTWNRIKRLTKLKIYNLLKNNKWKTTIIT